MTSPNESLLPVGGIIKRREAAIWSKAVAARQALIAEREATVAARAQVLEEARAEGHALGLEEGRAEASDLVLQVGRRLRHEIDLLERRLPDLVMDVVARLLGEFQPGDLLAAAVHRAVGELRANSEATLRIAPQHVDQVKPLLLAMQARPGAPRLHLQLDAEMTSGSCQLSGPFGSIDLSLERQLALLRDGLSGSWPRAVP